MTDQMLGTDFATQVAIVVHDVEATAKAWAELLGVPMPEIKLTDPVEQAHTLYNGEPTDARAKLAFFSLGQVNLELIEPVGRPSTWGDQLDAHGDSIHHVAFNVKGRKVILDNLAAAGMPTVQTGDYTGGHYAYVDAADKLGAILELLEND